MGLQIDIPVRNSGINASYWRVSSFNVDLDSNITVITMSGYVSNQHRIDGFSPISRKTIRWVGSDNPITLQAMTQGQAFQAAYVKLITDPGKPLVYTNVFFGATPVLE